MPITPHFDLSQTESHIVLKIRVPHVRVSPEQVQVVLTDDFTVLHFASPPYLLVLNFHDKRFHETAEDSCAQYDPTIENGIIRLELRKETPGVHWDNLDMLGRLAPKRGTSTDSNKKGGGSRWLQSVEGESGGTDEGNSVGDHDASGGDREDYVGPAESSVPGYGFLRMFRGVYSDLARDGLAKEMLEFPWEESGNDRSNLVLEQVPEEELRAERRRIRCELEREQFSPERYLGDLDLEEDYIYQCAMAMKPHWAVNVNSMTSSSVDDLSQQISTLAVGGGKESGPAAKGSTADDACISFTPEERSKLLSLPYPLLPSTFTSEQENALLMGLLDILYAYVYDYLMTDGDATVESAWTISIVSASLSCLEDWINDSGEASSMEESVLSVVCSSLRRSLIYPYFRNMDYSLYAWKQVTALLGRGIRPVIRSLLQIRSVLDRSELYYMGNKLFLDPYLAWLQAFPARIEKKLCFLSRSLENVLEREDLKDLLDLELRGLEESFLESNDSEHDESDSSTGSSSDDSSTGSSDSETQSEATASEECSTCSAGRADPGERVNAAETSGVLLDENLGLSEKEKISLLPTVELNAHSARSPRPLMQEIED